MFFLVFVLCAGASVGYGAPNFRTKRSPFAGGFAYAGPYVGSPFGGFGFNPFASVGLNPYAGVNPYAGRSRSNPYDSRSSASSYGTPYPSYASPWDYAGGYVPFPFMPFPAITMPQNWYDGENVCKEIKTADAKGPEADFEGLFADEEFSNFKAEFNHEQESCRGTNTKFLCVKRIFDSDGQRKIQATKFECCHGFVRNPNGPGCIENTDDAALNSNDKNYYDVRSSSSGFRGSISLNSDGSTKKSSKDAQSSSGAQSVSNVPVQ